MSVYESSASNNYPYKGVSNNPDDYGTETEGLENQDTYMVVTTHRAWRHTIGRISCLVRIPIYIVATLFQAGKIIIKGICSPVAWSFDKIFNTKILSSWEFTGVAKDVIALGTSIDRILNTGLCVLCAPPKQYHSFWEALKVSGRLAIGSYNTRDYPVKELFDNVIRLRPQYHKQIIQCKDICSDAMQYSSFKAYIKAG